MTSKDKKQAPFPTREQILEFIRGSPGLVGKREIARAFKVETARRPELKELLRGLEDEGQLQRGRGRRFAQPGILPPIAVVEVTGLDADGEILARPGEWLSEEPPPRIYIVLERGGRHAVGPGDRLLARLRRIDRRTYEGRIIRRLEEQPQRILGIYRRIAGQGRLQPTDRRVRVEPIVADADSLDAREGELVHVELLPGKRLGLPQARVVERLGGEGDARTISLIAILDHGIPAVFSPEALTQAENAGPAALGQRVDLRHIPLVTIDGEDARDFDDAVWAAPDPDEKNLGGWHLIVAIADVSWYVRPNDALDKNAYERGNSAYFPDRVVPMLPEALSNGWCSLKPGEDRPCMVAHLWIDGDGSLLRHRFERGLMRSAARLTYEQVQAAHDGFADDVAAPLVGHVLAPLYGAFAALLKARVARGVLELDVAERRVIIEDGKAADIRPRQRLDSHRLIEEFMVTANVAAAETLERLKQPCMYRVHDVPTPEKLEALRDFLETIEFNLPRGQVIHPAQFNRILERAAGGPHQQLVNEIILRSQAQAVYSPENIGHFGLALRRYAHFTSPIRRYADLLVHRALIRGIGLGDGALEKAHRDFREAGEHISDTERRAISAERDAVDRYTAAFLADRVGARLPGRVTGVTRFGLFVTLAESGGDGLVPISTLPDDRYDHDPARHALVGRRWGRTYRLGTSLDVELVESNPLTGRLLLNLADAEGAGDGARPRGRRPLPPRRGKAKRKKP